MKKGFLKTKKAMRAAEKAVDAEEQKEKESERRHPEDDNKMDVDETEGDKTETENNTKDNENDEPDEPEKKLEEIDLHEIPDYIRKQLDKMNDDRKRIVFRGWPRDPNGKMIDPLGSDIEGKMTSNGIMLWGATLYDFYKVRMKPDIPYFEITSTSSRLAALMRKFGELDFAPTEIAWADREDEPRQVYPCDISALIHDCEFFGNMGLFKDNSTGGKDEVNELGKTLDPPPPPTPKPKKGSGKRTAKGKEKEKEPSIFEYNPYPWPRNNPFVGRPPVLQKSLPYHLLPHKLVVHDPWDLLHVKDDSRRREEEAFTSLPDVVREYKLELTDAGKEKVNKSLQNCKKEADQWVVFDPKEEVVKPIDQCLIAAKVPSRPVLPDSIPEAHLFLSPVHLLGVGHHSYVYKAIWELPRWALVPDEPDVLCNDCFLEAVQREAERKFEAGDILTGEDSKKAAWVEFAEGQVFPADRQIYKSDAPNAHSLDGTGIAKEVNAGMMVEELSLPVKIETYDGPTIEVYPDVKWQNPRRGPVCEHLSSKRRDDQKYDTPMTARVQVAAKLSIQGDPQLAKETHNYQNFPDHFFEHWNGYNVISHLKDPVPVGAVCPQFYGFYVPEQADNKGKARQGAAKEYLSSILLVEHCGEPVEIDDLNKDDRQECASLLLKFHLGGYIHNSFKEANIVVQDGPLSAWPLTKMALKSANIKINSFRLIDFSRATDAKTAEEDRVKERTYCMRLFGLQSL